MVESAIQHKILLTSTAGRSGEDPRVYRRALQRGELIRLSRGAYLRRADWAEMSDTEKCISRIVAASLSSRSRQVISHSSAAVLWGIPIIGPLPQLVHVLASPSTGTRSEGGTRRHSTMFETVGVEVLDGVALTSFTRTLVEYVHMMPFAHGVVALDWALAPSTPARPKQATTAEAVRAMVSDLAILRGRRELLRTLEFADPRSGSPGESLSRVNIALAGLPAPELQTEFSDAKGRIGFVDFWWPDANLIGEFDGVVKYTQAEYTNGRAPADIVLAEKQREDRLRATATRPRVSRWGWKVANTVETLREQLVTAGLPIHLRTSVPNLDPTIRGRRGIDA